MTAGDRPRLVVFTSHPIQYQAPWFRAIERSGRFDLLVVFARIPSPEEQAIGFGGAFAWDVPLLDGYASTVLRAGRLPQSPQFLRRPALGVAALLRRHRPDAVLVLGWQEVSLIQAIMATRFAGIPLVLRGESNDLRPRPAPVRAAHRALVAQADGALSIGSANRRFFEAAGMPPLRIVDAPYFVDNEYFVARAATATARRQALRRQWGIPRDAVVPLFAGKLQPKKRPIDFLSALDAVGREGSGVHALVVGEGELSKACHQFAQERDIPVTFAGFLNQSRMPEAYAVSDFLVLPSDSGETWGLVVNEAMACGLPAIVSDEVGCAEDLVGAGGGGFSYRMGDVDVLVESMRQLIVDSELRRVLGDRARRRILQDYSVARAVEGLADIVQRVAPPSAPRRIGKTA